jgi:hypothetical protein
MTWLDGVCGQLGNQDEPFYLQTKGVSVRRRSQIHDEPCKGRLLRMVLGGAGDEIPPAYSAFGKLAVRRNSWRAANHRVFSVSEFLATLTK